MTPRFVLCLVIFAVSACGGGGDNAGTCFGGDQVCGLSTGNTSTTAAPPVNLSALTCDAVLALAGGSRPAAYLLAQQYFAQGATQLDSADPDPDACEEFR